MANVSNQDNILNPEQVAELGKKIYTEKLKKELESKHNGEFVVIEVQSGKHVIAKTLIEALEVAQTKFPNKLFHTIKIGSEGVFKMSTYSRRGFFYAPVSSR